MFKIAFVRCPQPILTGAETGAIYSVDRSRAPEPTLPLLEGIVHSTGLDVEVHQLDLRSPWVGPIEQRVYGELPLPYIQETVLKTVTGVGLARVEETLDRADAIGFTNNFAMSRRVVCDHIAAVRRLFPDKEIWVGGRDIYTQRVVDVYAEAAGRKNFVVFSGHVFESLPNYIRVKMGRSTELFGVTLYDAEGMVHQTPIRPINSGKVNFPLPIFPRPQELGYFTGSGEGQMDPPIKRFAHLTTSYGCPFSCPYCTTGMRERFLLSKSMEELASELDLYHKLGMTNLGVIDDNLLAHGPEQVKRVMALINSYDFKLEYGNGLQLSLLDRWWDELTGPIFEKCVSLLAPIEDLTVDRRYQKLAPLEAEFRLMQRLASETPGSLQYLTLCVLVGIPGHTREALAGPFMDNARRFLHAFKGSRLEVGMFVAGYIPLSGTVFGDQALASGRLAVSNAISENPEVFNFYTPIYAPENMTHLEVFQAFEAAANLNPASREAGVPFIELQRFGERALPENERFHLRPEWRTPGQHLRARVV